MKPVLSTEEVVRLEDIIEREGTSKAELMELAGEFAANEILKLNPDRVLVLVGFGNNGGDGWVAADILTHKGVDVDIVSPVEPDEIPAALARHVARRTAGRDVHVCVGPSRDELEVLIDKADVVVDAIFGTGFHGDLRAPFSIWIPTVNENADRVVSIDVPSGLNAETGVVDDDCIRAERTVTMIAPKIGLYSADGPEYAGDLVCGGLYDRLMRLLTMSTMLPRSWNPVTLWTILLRCLRISISTRAARCSLLPDRRSILVRPLWLPSPLPAQAPAMWQSRLRMRVPTLSAWRSPRFRSLLFHLIPAVLLVPLRA